MRSSRSSRATRRNARFGVSVSSDVAEEDDLGHYSPPRSPVEVSVPAIADGCVTNPDLDAVANWQRSKSTLHMTPWQCRRLCQATCRHLCAVKSSSPPRSVSPHEDVFQSGKGEPKAKQAVPSQNDDAEEQCVLCHDGHLLSVCPEFVNSTPNRRAEIAKNFTRCFACLDGVHNARRCPKRARCDVTHCNQRRHHLLHGSQRVHPPSPAADVVAEHSTVQTANIGANTEAIAHCVALREATTGGGFPLVKWASRRPEVLLSFPEGECSLTSLDLSPGTHHVDGVLGLFWDPREDAFRFPVTIPVGPVKTKRELFGSVACLYDSMGLLAPAVVKAKWMMRQATCESAGWDTVISEDIQCDYQRWLADLQSIRTLSIPRWLGFTSLNKGAGLHVFSDASDLAFGAVVCIRFQKKDGSPSTSLAMSKSRVALRRVLTIPRLELQAAVLAVRLGHTAADVMSIDSSGTTYWTDSMTVLKRLKIDTRKLKPFVAHRVSEVLANSEVSQWRHVPGKWNLADDVSRRVPASLLARTSHRWWCGPQFLQIPEESWPTASVSVDEDSVKQELAEHLLNVNALGISSSNAVLRLFDVHSDFSKIMRIVAYVRRFMRLIAVAKRALTAVLNGNTVTDELLCTVFAEVESLLNGRPLAYVGSDPSQPEPITPFSLLTGRVNVHVPPDVLCEPKRAVSKHCMRAIEISVRFWRRWHRDFLPTLQRRTKWTSPNRDPQVNDVVLIVDPLSHRARWVIGRVLDVFPGSDGRIRVAMVKTRDGAYKRPVARLAVLERADG
ncbi:Pao retrotransposon peptidase [Trichuris suis]|nr:Pao retrotransposon peptidase [Trichuris suis]